MSEHVYEDYDDYDEVLPGQPNGELVHWMEPRPVSFGPAVLSLAVAGAFAFGLAAALVGLGLSRRSGPERRMSLPLERKLRGLN
jgi:hypothetical protein